MQDELYLNTVITHINPPNLKNFRWERYQKTNWKLLFHNWQIKVISHFKPAVWGLRTECKKKDEIHKCTHEQNNRVL